MRKLPLLLTLVTLSLPVLAQEVPSYTVYPLFKIFDGAKTVRGTDRMSVKVSVDLGNNKLADGKTRQEIDGATYQRARELARAVFIATAGEDRGQADDFVAYGTAFHVGGNLILTNQHVLSPKRTNWTSCNNMGLASSTNSGTYACQKVLHCEPSQDWCLIRVRGISGFPSLPLRISPTPDSPDALLAALGNSGGFGMHFSEGRSVAQSSVPFKMKTHTPAFPGNSGGPLVNENNEVVGIVQSRDDVRAMFAVRLDAVFAKLRELYPSTDAIWSEFSDIRE